MRAEGMRLVVSPGGEGFAEGEAARSGGRPEVAVSAKAAGPALVGFGGAFNEKGWEALGLLPREERERVLSDLFSPGGGLRLNFGRIPVGSSDFALSRYSLAEEPGDWEMKGFSIERDEGCLLPYVKAAQALRPELRFWASAWSPPPWLKTNAAYDSGAIIDDPKVYAAYALYLCKFVEAYRAAGVPVEIVAVQNEPIILTHYPSCEWKPHQYLEFVRDHLGPMLKERKSGAGVMLGTFPQPVCASHALAVLSDPAARAYVEVLGLQWTGLGVAEAARKILPNLPVWNTETDCGNHHWEPGFDPDKPEADFGYANKTWGYLRDYLGIGCCAYTLWNMVLDAEGKSIDSARPWPQNAPVHVDRRAKKAVYSPMFYAFAHYSRHLPPGSRLLSSTGSEDAIAFALPEGGAAVLLRNPGRFAKRVKVGLGGRVVEARLPGRCFATLLAEKGSF